jgi:branched-chain amino acid transport system ATP-binding protein
MSEVLLRAVNVSKRFGGLFAVDSIDLDLHHAEIHAVIGPNGAGKTTFLATLAGDLKATTGKVLVMGKDVTGASVEARTRLGVGRTYQRSAIIGGFSAIDMVRLAAFRHKASLAGMLAPLAANASVSELARSALARVGLADRAEIVADMLSHGEKRRLEIAAVLALEPKILLLDEPLAGLGADESRHVVALVENLKRTCAIMLIEHDIDTVFAVADRITVLDNGRVIASGTPAAVRENAVVQQAYLGLADQP